MPKLTESDRMAIIAGRAAGRGVNELAKRYNVSRQSIWAVLSVLKKGQCKEAQEDLDATFLKNRLRRKSYDAVEAGLDDSADNYRRGNLGLGFLKGTGDLAPDRLSVNTFINACPPEWRERYFVTIDQASLPSPRDGQAPEPGSESE
jgi:hypothetical protein